MTADTYGTIRQELRGLPLELEIVGNGQDKAERVKRMGPEHVVVIGNGRNDVAMARLAALSIGVIGPEGIASELLSVVDVVVSDIYLAFDLLAQLKRLCATLRD